VLVIRRREGEAVYIGEAIAVQVLEISPSRVKLGIEAPRAVAVVRSEQRASAEENLRASASVTLTKHSVMKLLGPPGSA